MAYIPYRSDAPPPADESWEPPAPRRWPWISAIVLVVGGLAFSIWWVTREVPLPPPAPPLALIPLPDGTELRLVETIRGGSFNVRSDTDYGGRLRWDNGTRRGGMFGGVGMSSSGIGGGTAESVWLVFSHYDPATQKFTAPFADKFSVHGGDERFRCSGKAHMHGGPYYPPVTGVVFNVFPRRAREVTLSFMLDGRFVDATVANPFLDNSPPFSAKPLPQTAQADGVMVEFHSVKAVKRTTIPDAWEHPWRLSTDIKATQAGVPGAKFDVSRVFFDATGNVDHNFLPDGDDVWGARVTVSERFDYPFPPERVESLGKLKVPAAGMVVPIVLPAKFKSMGVTGAFVFGSGSYELRGGQILADGKVLGTVSQRRTDFINVSKHMLGIFSSGERGIQSGGALIRIRVDGVMLQAGTRGSSMTNNERFDEISHFHGEKGSVELKDGAEIEIEAVFPKRREVEFFFARPPLPE